MGIGKSNLIKKYTVTGDQDKKELTTHFKKRINDINEKNA